MLINKIVLIFCNVENSGKDILYKLYLVHKLV